jgi:uncharacterized membrane protein YphA (DoxX/SURF4 family)
MPYWIVATSVVGIRLLVGGVFLIAGIAKLKINRSTFGKAIQSYDLLPDPLAHTLAIVLPFVEVIVGSMMVLGFFTEPSIMTALLLLFVFTSATIITLLRRKKVEGCGCFGSASKMKPLRWTLVIRNMVLFILLSASYILMKTSEAYRFLALDNLMPSGLLKLVPLLFTIVLLVTVGFALSTQVMSNFEKGETQA